MTLWEDVSIAIRRARSNDSAAAANVLIASRAAAAPAIPPAVHSDAEVREWFEQIVMRRMEVWVVESQPEHIMVGVLALNEQWVEQLYVLPGWTGKGIGSRLLETARRRSPSGLELWTFQSNRRARSFYEREGFVAVEETEGAGNEERAPDVHYRWTP
ncbi:MAG: GNAT family N-acetyltransferase [Candidatus Dormibacteria bacterium]